MQTSQNGIMQTRNNPDLTNRGEFVRTFSYYVNLILEIKRNKARQTFRNFERACRLRLLHVFGDTPICDMNWPTIDSYLLARHGAGYKCADDVKHLNQVLRFARGCGEKVQHFKICNPDRPRGRGKCFTKQETDLLLKYSRANLITNCYCPELNLIIRMALTMGMRQHEILELKWGHVNLEEGYIYLPPEAQKTRTTVDREFQINKEVHDQLIRKYFENINRKDKKNINHQVFNQRDRHVVNHYWKKLKNKCGIEGRFHDLRHTCISRMLSANISHVIVQKMLGVSPQVMRRYTHIPKDIAYKAVNLVS